MFTRRDHDRCITFKIANKNFAFTFTLINLLTGVKQKDGVIRKLRKTAISRCTK